MRGSQKTTVSARYFCHATYILWDTSASTLPSRATIDPRYWNWSTFRTCVPQVVDVGAVCCVAEFTLEVFCFGSAYSKSFPKPRSTCLARLVVFRQIQPQAQRRRHTRDSRVEHVGYYKLAHCILKYII